VREDRRNVAGDKEFLLSETDYYRGSQTSGDNFVGILGRKGHERVSAGHGLDGPKDGLLQRSILGEFLDQMGDDFRVGFGDEFVTFGDKILFELDIILNDTVVHYDDFTVAVAVRMGIFLGRASVRRPAGVSDAVHAVQRSDADGFLEISQLAGGAANIELAVVADHCDPGRIIAAVLEPPQAVEDQWNNALGPDITDNSAHDEILQVCPGGGVRQQQHNYASTIVRRPSGRALVLSPVNNGENDGIAQVCARPVQLQNSSLSSSRSEFRKAHWAA